MDNSKGEIVKIEFFYGDTFELLFDKVDGLVRFDLMRLLTSEVEVLHFFDQVFIPQMPCLLPKEQLGSIDANLRLVKF